MLQNVQRISLEVHAVLTGESNVVVAASSMTPKAESDDEKSE